MIKSKGLRIAVRARVKILWRHCLCMQSDAFSDCLVFLRVRSGGWMQMSHGRLCPAAWR